MLHYVLFVSVALSLSISQATPKRKVQMDVEIWKNGRLDSMPQLIVTEGEEGVLSQSSDLLTFKMQLTPKNSPFSDKAFKISLEYTEVKEGQEQEPLHADIESSSYESAVVRYLPPTEGAEPIELKITARPL